MQYATIFVFTIIEDPPRVWDAFEKHFIYLLKVVNEELSHLEVGNCV